mgnify:CR=1 FL=1
MIKQIATVAVYVENQDKAIEFYTKILGFKQRAKNLRICHKLY